jgi:hypothetical protein
VYDNTLLNTTSSSSTFSILDPLNIFSTSDANNNNLTNVYTQFGTCCSFELRMDDYKFDINIHFPLIFIITNI